MVTGSPSLPELFDSDRKQTWLSADEATRVFAVETKDGHFRADRKAA